MSEPGEPRRAAGALEAVVHAAAADDLLTLARAHAAVPLFYWEHPASGEAMLAIGVAREIHAAGPDRFAVASAAALRTLAAVDGPPAARAALRMVGGFGFSDHAGPADDLPAARLVLPRRLWLRTAAGTTRIDVWERGGDPGARAAAPFPAAPDAAEMAAPAAPRLVASPLPSAARAAWQRRVDRVRARIEAGELRKVVLARRRRFVAEAPVDPAALLARARATRPTCVTIWMRTPGGASLVASTPELLVRRRGVEVTAGALAGSAPRAADPVADRAAAAALRSCPKNAWEHAIVVAAVREALAAVADGVAASAPPVVVSLPEVHHLATTVTGRLRGPATVLDVGGLLHPTPAVCGTPREAARRLIEAEEPERGWYTGALGWMDAGGDGALVVALRSALVAGREVTVWAGAGIVDGSDAEAELAETELKMRALVAPFLAPSTAITAPASADGAMLTGPS